MRFMERWCCRLQRTLPVVLLFVAVSTVSNAQVPGEKVISASSLRGKVMAGYQGWFRAKGDTANQGWVHWSRDSSRIAPDTVTFELWPDMSECTPAERFPASGFTYPDGSQAELYSAENSRTVQRHFEWMRDYCIDGAWLQHFVVDLPGGPIADRYPSRLKVLDNVRAAAKQTGRVWALSYDIAGAKTEIIYKSITEDWRRMVDRGITRDPRYLHDNGKPVVQIWGFYYKNQSNLMTAELGEKLIAFFKAPGPYQACFVGGGDWNWRNNPDPEWHALIQKMDAYVPWNIGNYSVDPVGVKSASTGYWDADRADCDKMHVTWIPSIYPGFGWDNIFRYPRHKSEIARRGGMFFWEQWVRLAKMGDRQQGAYIGMFDEVDEGTAIFKVTNHPPIQGYFQDYDGKPSDWYLRLAGEGIRMLRGKRPISPDIPIKTNGISPTVNEMKRASAWAKCIASPGSNPLPFSFIYNGASSQSLIEKWPAKKANRQLDSHRTETTITRSDPATGLEVTTTAITYSDYPAVEWTVRLKNTGTSDTPILEKIQGFDARFPSGAKAPHLHGLKGDYCVAESYEPFNVELERGSVKRFSPPGSGKSCDGPNGWPYFNLQISDGGVMAAVGWPGQWAASFARENSNSVHITAGQQLTHLKLHPGEEIRTPLIALLFWQGEDIVRSQNLWRRWYMEHTLPRTLGVPQRPIVQIQVEGSESNIAGVKAVLDAGIRPDICWRDAGGTGTWYPSSSGPYKGGDVWLNTGTWDVDPAKYPSGFKPFSDWVRSQGMQFLLWFEPERVGDPNSYLGKNHPEWLLPGESHGSLLDLGNPYALDWLTNHVNGMVRDQGLDWYREDMNGGGPLPAWRKADAPDRQGITENHYVQGHLAFWDGLRSKNPGLKIDSCASGGRRNDLESMRRAVPLLRSDFQFPDMPGVIEGNQAQTYGLSSWLPYQGTGCYFPDLYALRSFYLPGFGTVGESSLQKKAYAECARLAPLMLADYYPLTPYSRNLDKWIAWQFNKPETGEGALQAFRRKDCSSADLNVKLQGLNPNASYEVTNQDDNARQITLGASLMKQGIMIHVSDHPGSALLMYRLSNETK